MIWVDENPASVTPSQTSKFRDAFVDYEGELNLHMFDQHAEDMTGIVPTMKLV